MAEKNELFKKYQKVEKSIYHSAQTDSYYVNIGRLRTRSFPNLEDARRYRDALNEQRLKAKIAEDLVEDRIKENNYLKQLTPYPFNLIDAIDEPTMTEEQLERYLKDLTDKERDCIRLYYVKTLSLDVIGKTFGVSRERIRQIVCKALRKLKQRAILYPRIEERKAREKAMEEDLRKLNEYREKLLAEFIAKGIYTEEMKIEFGEVYAYSRRGTIFVPVGLERHGIEELNLSVRSNNCLRLAGIQYIYELTDRTYEDMMKVRNLGKKCLKEIIDRLKEFGLSLRGYEEEIK